MNGKSALILLFVFFSNILNAQSIKGKVVDEVSLSPLAGASVYISNTSVGTTTNEKGEFSLNSLLLEQSELVVSYIGYATKGIKVNFSHSDSLIIKLQQKNSDLNEVVVRGYEKNGWEKWGHIFTDVFIGTTPFSGYCRIQNPKDIRFIFSKSQQILQAYAVKPIIIVNKALGYRIEYDLEDFVYDFDAKMITYMGFAFFSDLKGSKRTKFRRQKNRTEAYEGSAMQFMRAVYQNKISGSGFEVRQMILRPNLEQRRIRAMYRNNPIAMQPKNLPVDTAEYYARILRQEEYFAILYPPLLSFDNFASKVNERSVSVDFDNYLQIKYPAKKPDNDYYSMHAGARYENCITATLTLQNEEPIVISSSGNYFNPTNLIMSGYWSWSEKISNMLPLDFNPTATR